MLCAGKGRWEGNTYMPDTTIHAIDKSLAVLLQAEKDFPGYSLDFCSGYVSTDGVLHINYFTACTIIASMMCYI